MTVSDTNSIVINIDDNIYDISKKDKMNINICTIVCIFTILLPFTICDLYFGFNEQPCLTTKFNGINFGIGTWLKTLGFMNIIFILLLVITQFQSENLSICMTISIQLIFSFFSIIWTIIGAVLFWRYIEPDNLCDKQLTGYLWTRLILGLISAGGVLCSNKNRD